MSMKTLFVIAVMLAGTAFAWNGAMHPWMNSSTMHPMDTLSTIECRTNATITLLDNQTNGSLANYSAALQKDETALAGYAASGDGASFWTYLKGSYIPDLKAAFMALRHSVGGMKAAWCGPLKGMGRGMLHFRMHHRMRGG
jgi:hypothetical protein